MLTCQASLLKNNCWMYTLITNDWTRPGNICWQYTQIGRISEVNCYCPLGRLHTPRGVWTLGQFSARTFLHFRILEEFLRSKTKLWSFKNSRFCILHFITFYNDSFETTFALHVYTWIIIAISLHVYTWIITATNHWLKNLKNMILIQITPN
jgi:hypothetical protein